MKIKKFSISKLHLHWCGRNIWSCAEQFWAEMWQPQEQEMSSLTYRQGYKVSIGLRHGRDIWDIYVVSDNTYLLFWALCMPSTWKKAINLCLLPFASSVCYLKKSLSSLSSHPRISDKISFYGLNYFLNPTIFDSKGKQESPGEDWQDPAHRATVTCDGWTWGHLDSCFRLSVLNH